VIKICLRGNCKGIQLISSNGRPSRCLVRIELDHSIPLAHDSYDIQLVVPVEFGTLLEPGEVVAVTLEQNGLGCSS
jgi:hypothetical protein